MFYLLGRKMLEVTRIKIHNLSLKVAQWSCRVFLLMSSHSKFEVVGCWSWEKL